MEPKVLIICFLGFIIMMVTIPSSEKAAANYFPFGNPDIAIRLMKTPSDPINIDEENFNLLLEDIGKLPTVVNGTILPHVRDVFIGKNATLHNQYIEYIVVNYDMDKQLMRINLSTKPNIFPEQTVEVSNNGAVLDASSQMSTIRNLIVWMPVYWNYTREDLNAHLAMMSLIEDLNLLRTELLAKNTIDSFNSHKADLLSVGRIEGSGKNTTAALSYIELKMLDREIARITAYNPEDENGNWTKAIDDIKVNNWQNALDEFRSDASVVPEFSPIIVWMVSAIGVIAAILAIRLKRHDGHILS